MKNRFTVRDLRDGDFFWIDNCFLDEGYAKKLGVYCLAVYNVLAKHAYGKKGVVFPSYQTIADLIGCSRYQVIKSVSRLEAHKIIAKEPRWDEAGDRKSNYLYLLSKDNWTLEP